MKLWQEEFLTGFLTRLAPGPVKPASIMLEHDLEDGVIRSWPRQDERLSPLLANALTPVHPEFRAYTRSIAFRRPQSAHYPAFSLMPTDLFLPHLRQGRGPPTAGGQGFQKRTERG